MEAGANADQADVDGWTPLRAAAWGGHTEASHRFKYINFLEFEIKKKIFH